MIIQNMYVDNLLGGVEDLADAKALYEFTKQEFAKANMNLREWASNIPEFETHVDRGDLAVLKETTKIFGIIWKPYSDALVFSSNNVSVVPPYTKRKVLNQSASNYDLLGYLTPVFIKAKPFFQKLCVEKYEWDQVLSESLGHEWEEVANTWKDAIAIELPRFILSSDATKIQMHAFTDASAICYAVAVYIRFCEKGERKSTLIFSKSRLKPCKEVTISRLELLAVWIGVKALEFVRSECQLTVKKTILWTDSKCALD